MSFLTYSAESLTGTAAEVRALRMTLIAGGRPYLQKGWKHLKVPGITAIFVLKGSDASDAA